MREMPRKIHQLCRTPLRAVVEPRLRRPDAPEHMVLPRRPRVVRKRMPHKQLAPLPRVQLVELRHGHKPPPKPPPFAVTMAAGHRLLPMQERPRRLSTDGLAVS